MSSADLDATMPWVIFLLQAQRYAVPSRFVREMTIIDNPTRIPNVPDFVRGVFNLRGNILPVIDLRAWLGLPSGREAAQQLIAEMQRREQDHREWLHELERSIQEHRPFTKATDPHQCAFGKWYDNFKTDNIFVRGILREFDAPHKAIHAIAVKALAAAERGDLETARTIVQETREGALHRMIELFGRFRENLQDSLRDTVIVVEHAGRGAALVVDQIESVRAARSDVRFDAGAARRGRHPATPDTADRPKGQG